MCIIFMSFMDGELVLTNKISETICCNSDHDNTIYNNFRRKTKRKHIPRVK